MLNANYKELISAIDEYEDPDSPVTHSDEEISRKLLEFNRRFNNYVMTVTNQRDYADKEISKLKELDGGMEVESAYISKIQELSIDQDGLFFTHIRNIFTHDFVPSASGRVRFDTSTMDEPERKIIIQKRTLLQSDLTSNAARAYLDPMPEKINIREEVQSFHSNIAQLYDWFNSYLEDSFRELLEEQDKMADKIFELLHEIESD